MRGGMGLSQPETDICPYSAAGLVEGAADVIEDVLTRVLCRKGAERPA